MNAFHPILVCAAISSLAFGATSVYPPKQQGHIRCLKLLTLKDVFDSGFRPYRVIESKCRVGKADLMISLPGSNESVLLDADMISFTISRTDTVKAIDIRTMVAPVNKTGETLRQLASSLGISFVGLDEAMARSTPDNPKHTDTWTQDWSNEWLSIRFGFQAVTYFLDDASKGYREMKSYAVLGIEWKPTEIGPTYRETPITPPQGYEHISMAIPSSDLVRKAQTSDSPALAHLRYSDEKLRQAIIATTAVAAPKLQPPPTPSASTPWGIIAVLIFVTLGLLWLLLKQRAK